MFEFTNPHLRELIVPSDLIYRREEGCVWVLALTHRRRDLGIASVARDFTRGNELMSLVCASRYG